MKYSIRTAILSIVGLAAISMCALVGLSFYTHDARDTSQAEVERVEKLDATLVQLELAFLQARRAEKDFLLRRDDKYVDRHAEVVTQLNSTMDSARNQTVDLAGMEDISSNLDLLQDAVASYARSFSDVVATSEISAELRRRGEPESDVLPRNAGEDADDASARERLHHAQEYKVPGSPAKTG